MNLLTRQIVVGSRADIGIHETTRNSGPEIDAWLLRVKRKPGKAWCAAWAWCKLDDAIRAMGYTNPLVPTAGVHLLVARAKSLGAWTREPGAGYIYAIDHGRDKLGNRIGHCGIVEEVNPPNLLTISGNTNAEGSREGNCVAEKTIPIASCTLGFIDPSLLVVEQEPK